MDNYTALIIDLKKSRSYNHETRYLIQTYMMKILDVLNTAYSKSILRDVDFSAGDEIQGLFMSPEAAYLYYRMLSIWLYPIKIRAGIGIGTWDLKISGKGTTSQDGKVYHNARHAINYTDELEGYSVLCYSGRKNDLTINTMIGSIASISGKLSMNQNQLSLIVEMLYPVFLSCKPIYLEDWESMVDLFKYKNDFDHKVNKSKKSLPFDNIRDDRIDIPFDFHTSSQKYINDTDFFITSGKQRGIPSVLANILTLSRQTIATSLYSGNIYMIRNMVITALKEMDAFSTEEIKP